jgi:formate dehydrogenase iron-sulfur subunit
MREREAMPGERPERPGPDLIRWLLDRQRDPTAVERFAQRHAEADAPLQHGSYRALIPLTAPGPGEQYGFEVELDRCSGCKACVTACHNLNGLEADETWRSVGLLHGDAYQQTVTTACHHCLDPACLEGCPVDAYDKDPVTGIVRHLDDQCIGCQYCVLMCPYEVPQYSRAKGIVRKCDMCHGRLAAGEAPACVQACPSQAIRIGVVAREAVAERAAARTFLPEAPDPSITRPATSYRTSRAIPADAQPADHHASRIEKAHPPLAGMLVLTQMSVGTFAVGQLAGALAPATGSALMTPLAVAALLCCLAGLGVSVLHLGRPRYAFRTVLGLRRSWLSREIVAFGAYTGLAAGYLLVTWRGGEGRGLALLGGATAAMGLVAVLCSVMVYVATRRPCWRGRDTGPRFALSAAVLGVAAALVVSLAASWWLPAAADAIRAELTPRLCLTLAALAGAKLAWEASPLRHARALPQTIAERRATLMRGPLRHLTAARFACGVLGGVSLPLIALAAATGPATAVLAMAASLVLAGELFERHLFFVAAPAPRMPGGVP